MLAQRSCSLSVRARSEFVLAQRLCSLSVRARSAFVLAQRSCSLGVRARSTTTLSCSRGARARSAHRRRKRDSSWLTVAAASTLWAQRTLCAPAAEATLADQRQRLRPPPPLHPAAPVKRWPQGRAQRRKQRGGHDQVAGAPAAISNHEVSAKRRTAIMRYRSRYNRRVRVDS